MRRYLYPFLLLGLLLYSCTTASESQGRNPKTADVEIKDGQVVISIPTTTPYFHLEKVQDDSVEFSQILFQYDSEMNIYQISTDLEDWQPLPAEENMVKMGQVSIMIAEETIIVTYPSGTWAFP